MRLVYEFVLSVSAAAAAGLVAWRLRRLLRGPRPALGRLLNEWAWTLVPLLILGALIWRAFSVK